MNKSEEYAQNLRNARNKAGLTQTQAESYLRSRGLRVSARSLSKWENGEGPPKQIDGRKVLQLLESYRPSRDPSKMDDPADRDPIYPTAASQGDSSLEVGEKPIGYIDGEEALSSPGRDVFWVLVRGDSMQEKLPKGGLVPVQKFDPTWTDLREDDVYLFRLEETIQVKRLQRRPGQRIRVVSDNDAYDDFDVGLDDGVDFEVLGRILV